ncbi:hypothetical protein TRV_05604, partial [Trichophyton verrucosum HKI 0517]
GRPEVEKVASISCSRVGLELVWRGRAGRRSFSRRETLRAGQVLVGWLVVVMARVLQEPCSRDNARRDEEEEEEEERRRREKKESERWKRIREQEISN